MGNPFTIRMPPKEEIIKDKSFTMLNVRFKTEKELCVQH